MSDLKTLGFGSLARLSTNRCFKILFVLLLTELFFPHLPVFDYCKHAKVVLLSSPKTERTLWGGC